MLQIQAVELVANLEEKHAENQRPHQDIQGDAKLSEAENARMAKLYREQILKEAPLAETGLVQIGGIAPAPPKVEQEEVGSYGD